KERPRVASARAFIAGPSSLAGALGASNAVEMGSPALAYQLDHSHLPQAIGHLLRQLSPDAQRLRQIPRGKWLPCIIRKARLQLCPLLDEPSTPHLQQPPLLNDPPTPAPLTPPFVTPHPFFPCQQHFKREVGVHKQVGKTHHLPEQILYPPSPGRLAAG